MWTLVKSGTGSVLFSLSDVINSYTVQTPSLLLFLPLQPQNADSHTIPGGGGFALHTHLDNIYDLD